MNGDTPMDSRVHVLESDYKRLEEEVRDHGKRLVAVENCMAGLPRIEGILKDDVLPVLKMLNECKIADEATKRIAVSWWETMWGQRAWDIIRAAALVILTLLFAVNQHLVGAK